MKKHAIIPVFIPHLGCPNDCVFCNQKIITARQQAVTEDDVRKTVTQYLSTLRNSRVETIELAFFGGSFTGLTIPEQNRYLDIAVEYKRSGLIHKIHMSTRPDYIDDAILDNLGISGASAGTVGGSLASAGSLLSGGSTTITYNNNVSAPVTITVQPGAASSQDVGNRVYSLTERYLLRTVQGVLA